MNDKTVNQNQVYTSTEAAKILDVNPRTIVKLCKEGQIKSKKIKGYKILGKSILDYFYGEVIEEIKELKGEIQEFKEDEKNRG